MVTGSNTATPRDWRVGAPTLVALGAAVGALARWAITSGFDSVAALPAINIVGSLLLGVLWGCGFGSQTRVALVAATGFCGGFTSFSSFALALARGLVEGSGGSFLIAGAGTVIGAIAAVGAGHQLGRRFGPGRP